MSNETIMQGLLDSLMKRPEDATQQRGALLANIMNTPNPLAATVASMLPGQMANVNQAARGLFGLKAPVSPAQKIQEMITANPALMNTSAGLTQLAQLASASGDRATALLMSGEASRLAQLEKEKMVSTAKTQVQVGTTINYLTDLIAGTKNEQAKTELKALISPAASGAQTADQVTTQANNILERYKLTPIEAEVVDYKVPGNDATVTLRTNKEGMVFYQSEWADPGQLGFTKAPTKSATTGGIKVEDYELPNGSVLALRTDETSGLVNYQGKWQDAGALGFKGAATRSTTSGRAATLKEVPNELVSAMVARAIAMGYVSGPDDPNAISLAGAVRGEAVKDAEGLDDWMSKMPNTPAWDKQQATIKNNALAAVAPSLRNLQSVNAILNDPTSLIGDKWSYIEDFAFNTDAARLKQAIAPVVSDAALRQIGTLKQQAAELGGEGTGLGAISVNEFDALQNSIENMKTGRTADDLRESVADYELHLYNIRNLNSGRPLLLVKGDPVYSGLPFEQGPDGQINIILNGTRVPVSLHDSVDEAITYNKVR
jgi:hypothetical protein